MRAIQRLLIALCGLCVPIPVAHAQKPAAATLPSYRNRLLGVFDGQTGEPIEGAEVSDALSKTVALTTKTGTVSLAFLPDGGTLVRVRKVGYAPEMLMVVISPVDTVPLTILLSSAAKTLPTVVTTDSLARVVSPRLREFEERRRQGFGYFVTNEQLRKDESRSTMTNVVRRFPGVTMVCPRRGMRSGQCWATGRQGCAAVVYIDGMKAGDNDLQKMLIPEFAAVEYYAGGATAPIKYNATGSSCGVLLFWTRDR